MKRRADIERTDAELLREALEHREPAERRSAASALLERYQDRVYVWCFRMVREHEQACDMAQDVLIKAYRKLDTFEGRSEFSSWLFTIARNRCLSALRRPSILEADREAPEPVDPTPRPDQRLIEKMDEGAILELLRERLEPIEQDVIWLRCFEGLPVEDITRILRIEAASGARGLLQRARRKLRAAMASHEERDR